MRGFVVGIDLSGPANVAETAAAVFDARKARLDCVSLEIGLGDGDLCRLLGGLSARGPVAVGLDAPLSYNEGGGDRSRDRDLRTRLIEAGLPSGSVMTPTMTRMAYLTLRGVTVARLIRETCPEAPVCEVHPGGAMALRGAPIPSLRAMKRDGRARRALARWLADQGLDGLPARIGTDHELAAIAGALATWHWQRGQPVFCAPAHPPHHPCDMVC